MASTYNKDPLGYYEVLNSGYDDDAKIIKRNYRDKAKQWHPDYNDTEEALETFQKISVAYDILQDDRKRLIYDLLATIYTPKNFPDMFALKAYKNKKGLDDINIRALMLKKRGKLVKEICNYSEAKLIVLKNFVTNFWNIPDVIYNFKNMDKHYDENICLMLHNALAYEAEGNKSIAYVFANRALGYANDYQVKLIKIFMKELKVSPKVSRSNWNFNVLKVVELSIPLLLVMSIFIPYSSRFITDAELSSKKEINYYQEVRFRTGGETVDDVVVSKILSFPVDVTDYGMLYYVTARVPVMYGPSPDFDILTYINQHHTVRVTGVSPDKVWYRIMLDNGDMGFVPSKYLKAGIGNKIPEGSKIFKEP